MNATANSAEPHAPIFGWRRVRVVLVACALLSLPMAPGWKASYGVLYARCLIAGFGLLLVFGAFERWPRRLPGWIARWGLQVAMVALAVPVFVAIAYSLTTIGIDPPWFRDRDRLGGFTGITILGLLAAPWIAVAALLRQIKEVAQKQALAFELERSEYERRALDARLRLLQAQVEPHFLFNTLANVRELVDRGSPQASSVLGSLIAYLRAAVPRLHEPSTTLGQEIELVRAYLDVMHMRMTDRLQFALDVDPLARGLALPPMSVLALVENAVRHGIDPCEEGGRIDIEVRRRADRCLVRVRDTGAGFGSGGDGLGTGLATLRERLQLVFGAAARLSLDAVAPHGVEAVLDLPAREVRA